MDGAYVRDLPGRELLNGNFVKNVSILQGHNEWFLVVSMLIVEMRD
jgi:hypothetical protein